MKKISLVNLFLNSRLLIMAILISLGYISAISQNQPYGSYIDKLETTSNWWNGPNTSPGTIMKSAFPSLGVQWSTYGFTIPTTSSYLSCGLKDIDYISTLTCINPVEEAIGIVTVNLLFDSDMDYLNSVVLRISPYSDFSEYIDLDTPKLNSPNAFWNFYIPNPTENQYYQLRINFAKYKNDWIHIANIYFYPNDFEFPTPIVNKLVGSENFFTVTSTNGDLHVLASIYDKDYNFIQDAVSPPNSSKHKIATDTDDINWNNKVAIQGEPYQIVAPSNPDYFTKIRAKSTNGNGQSEELVTWISTTYGITTDMPTLEISDENIPIQWYNLQGMKVENPSNGIFIKKEGSKTTKVKL